MVEYSTKHLPRKVRYLMGVGEPIDILNGVEKELIFLIVLIQLVGKTWTCLYKI